MASTAAELANIPACQPFIPIELIKSITSSLDSFLFPQTKTSQSILWSLCNSSAEMFWNADTTFTSSPKIFCDIWAADPASGNWTVATLGGIKGTVVSINNFPFGRNRRSWNGSCF